MAWNKLDIIDAFQVIFNGCTTVALLFCFSLFYPFFNNVLILRGKTE